MRPVKPHVEVPGDNPQRIGWHRPNIMARSGELVGFSREHAVWRFGFLPQSESAAAYGVSTDAFVWVLATLRTGKVKETFDGFGAELPDSFARVLNAEIR